MRSYFRKDYKPAIANYTYPIRSFVPLDAYTNEDILPLSTGVYAYNVQIKNGRIYQSDGVSNAVLDGVALPDTASLGSHIINAAIYRRYDYTEGERDDMLVFLLENKKFYYMRFSDMRYVYSGTQFSTKNVTFLNFHGTESDILLAMTDDELSYTFDGQTVRRFEAPPSKSACVHGTRVFCVNGDTNVLSFSKSLVPTHFSVSPTGGGYIGFPDEGGALTGVIGWKSYVYVFREFAVHRLNSAVDQGDFSVTKAFETTSRIYFDTVAVCNDRMIFLAEDGFYSFDGFTLKKTMGGLFPLIAGKERSHAAFFGGKYYLATELKTDGERVGDEQTEALERNGVIRYDVLHENTGVFRGTDIRRFLPLCTGGKSLLLLFFGNTSRRHTIGMFDGSGRLFGTPLKKLWRSPYTDLGQSDKIKVLKRMFIRTVSDITLKLVLDKKYPAPLIGGKESKMIPVNHRAERVGFEIETESDSLDISGVLFEFAFVRRIPNE